MKKECWNCKNDNQYANFPCDYCHTGNIDDFWKPKDEMKDFAIEELEKIKAEIEEIRMKEPLISRGFECYGFKDKTTEDIKTEVIELLEEHISELKGENK